MKMVEQGELRTEYRREDLGKGIRGKYLRAYLARMDSGEMRFPMFDYSGAELEPLIESAYEGRKGNLDVLKELQLQLGKECLPDYLLTFIENTMPRDNASIAVHKSQFIDKKKYKSADIQNIARPRGFIGTHELEENRFPDAMHHLKIIFNSAGKGRVFYRYVGSIGF